MESELSLKKRKIRLFFIYLIFFGILLLFLYFGYMSLNSELLDGLEPMR